ncbi:MULTISPECIES: YczE/YyaS/YitT family protein [unclassified Candidatus Frackibacter]|uniref:YczE/YyaS/YitT family protein n=1 Tax=unclassified Candidatus Frackibacter TaxID=2648818 RepID=UPI0008890F54|nr:MULTISPECIES: membrane protein [unclassified Candidatus Frackibacter]SDC64798.1 hypothetical protein SAMN04515661_11756 [Candidatus Frackibacter sp. WG11]SEM77228.1 hypothetical protein SAMN04488698_1167 [Candidatus Frackibacter sp. WG12]SFL88866.1 hypothetical protein SAMN04488699_11855 [Candidatus Frackibacter sp. WG13]
MQKIKKWSIFVIGLFIVSIGIVLTIKADLGVSPWDVFHIGLTKYFDVLTVGRASQLTGLIVITLSYILGQIKPNIGTVINMLLVGFMIDFVMTVIPEPTILGYRYIYLIAGTILFGLGAGIYISSHCGTGPRDSLMMALDRKLDINIQWVRSGMELAILILGYFLGGPVGIGTVCIAIGIGPVVGFSLDLMENLSRKSAIRANL